MENFGTTYGIFTGYAKWLGNIKRSSETRGGVTGYGRRGSLVLFWALILSLVYIVGIALGGFNFIGQQLSSVSRGGVISAPAGASAFCPTSQTVGLMTSPPAGCSGQRVLLSVHVVDAFAGALAATTYSCKFWSPTGAFYEDVLSFGSNGLCTTVNQFDPGTPVVVEVCKLTTSCGSTAYAQQKTAVYYPLPCGNGLVLGGTPCPGASFGTVSFGTPTTSPPQTVTVNMPIEKITGDAYATNTPNTITISWPNGTTFSASNTGFCNSGTKSLGAAWNLGFTVQVGTSGTTPGNPFGAGYQPFNPVDINSVGPTAPSYRGVLTDVLQIEIKETSTTGTTLTPTTGPLTRLVAKPASVPDIIYTVPLNGLALAQSSTGAPGYLATTPGGNQGIFSFTQGFDCTAVKNGSAVTVTITCDYFQYYSTTYVSNNYGSANTEAIKTSATNTVTVKT